MIKNNSKSQLIILVMFFLLIAIIFYLYKKLDECNNFNSQLLTEIEEQSKVINKLDVDFNNANNDLVFLKEKIESEEDEEFINNPVDKHYDVYLDGDFFLSITDYSRLLHSKYNDWVRELEHVNYLISENHKHIDFELAYNEYYEVARDFIGHRSYINSLSYCAIIDVNRPISCGTGEGIGLSIGGIDAVRDEVFYLYNRYGLEYDFIFTDPEHSNDYIESIYDVYEGYNEEFHEVLLVNKDIESEITFYEVEDIWYANIKVDGDIKYNIKCTLSYGDSSNKEYREVFKLTHLKYNYGHNGEFKSKRDEVILEIHVDDNFEYIVVESTIDLIETNTVYKVSGN